MKVRSSQMQSFSESPVKATSRSYQEVIWIGKDDRKKSFNFIFQISNKTFLKQFCQKIMSLTSRYLSAQS